MHKIEKIKEFHTALDQSFQKIFLKQKCEKEIKNIITAIENKKPILNLIESDKGSFSTIFLPFHSKSVFPHNFKELQKKYPINKKLLQFCQLAGKIESLTCDYVLYENEPSPEEKNRLLKLLQEFLTLLPSYTEFKRWLK